MKFLAKINRGLILLSIVLVAVAIYIIAISAYQAEEKPHIKEVCQKYISTAIGYRELPEKYRKENPEIPQAELDKYIEDMTRDLKAFYTDSEETYKYLIARNKEDLEQQAKGEGVVFKYIKDIKEYKNFVFEGSTVTVSILTNTVLDGPNPFEPGRLRDNISSQTTDTITLQKIDGKWKIIYADLQDPMVQSGNESELYRK